VISEDWEFLATGTKYFSSSWKLFNAVALSLHIAVLVSRYNWANSSSFTKSLAAASTSKATGFVPDLFNFEEEAAAANLCAKISSVMLLFLWGQAVQYLNDIFPRIGVLVNTVSRSITPVFFLVFIIADVFLGFVIWSNLMFGGSVAQFKDFGSSGVACTEMLLGNITPFINLTNAYPVSGFVFYVLYMISFFFILQYLSKAIVLLSYDDASKSYEATRAEDESRRAAESDRGNDNLTKVWKIGVYAIRRCIGKSPTLKDVQLPKTGVHRDCKQERSAICMFLVFLVIYTVMAILIIEVQLGSALTTSVRSALTLPTFTTTDSISGETIQSQKFYDISTRGQALAWLTEALPQALYNSSTGTLYGGQNPLQTYFSALPAVYNQLVINDWNVVVGQTPVRLSLKYVKMESSSSDSAAQLLNIPQVVLGSSAVTDFSDISSHLVKQVVRKYCNYTQAYGAFLPSTQNGFACMLKVSPDYTLTMLGSMYEADIFSNQIEQVAVEFVVYNGNLDRFLYTAIEFNFQPSGEVQKELNLDIVHLHTYSGAVGIIRLILEILVIAFTQFYLALSLRGIYKAVLNIHRKGRKDPLTCLQRVILIVRVITMYIFGDPFIFLDLMSSIMTVATMVIWYTTVLSPLAQDFYFPEGAFWDSTQCSNNYICSDSDVIYQFGLSVGAFRWLRRICAVNTVLIYIRALKYFQISPHVTMILNTLIRSAFDIVWFIITVIVVLFAYVTMGHAVFGAYVYGFSNLSTSFTSCFQMFLGTFKDFKKMKETDLELYYIFWYSYTILFRYVLINMFFAILDKNFRIEDADLKNKLKEAQAAQGSTSQRGGLQTILSFARSFVPSRKFTADVTEADDLVQGAGDIFAADGDEDEGELASVPTTDPASTAQGLSAAGDPMFDDDTMPAAADIITEDVVKKATTWKYLPHEIQEWALDTSRDIYKFIEEHVRQRTEKEKSKDQYELERVLDEAESVMKETRKRRGKDAARVRRDLERNELRKLKEIHQDQESLAWYIMKREAELKKLEEAKALKIDRSDKMMNAAKSLISAEKGGT
jgi:hypothetical protein